MSIWFPLRALFGSPRPLEEWSPPELLEEPDAQDVESKVSPVAAPLHVLSGSALIRVKESTLVVEREGEAPFERPLELVSAIHIHGWAGVTSPAIAALLKQGTSVIWRGATGFPIGCSLPLHSAGLEARRNQYRHASDGRGLDFARSLVAAKIINMRGIVRRKATLRGRERSRRGIAQGSPISPLLANLYLHPVDRQLGAEGYCVVRYADDLVVQAATVAAARDALRLLRDLLNQRGLALNRAKTRIVPPCESFVFLGETLTASNSGRAAPVEGMPT